MTEPYGKIIVTDADLPSKGEEMIAVLREKYLCNNTTHTYRISPHSSEQWTMKAKQR
jgi:hypothetical protein